MADIIYTLEGGTYFNLTNKCPCNCAFCIRSKGDAVGDAKELWFDKEPTFDDIKNAIDNYDFSNVTEAVFCGYGEPTCAYDNLIKTAKYLKKIKPSIKLRINTEFCFFHDIPYDVQPILLSFQLHSIRFLALRLCIRLPANRLNIIRNIMKKTKFCTILRAATRTKAVLI